MRNRVFKIKPNLFSMSLLAILSLVLLFTTQLIPRLVMAQQEQSSTPNKMTTPPMQDDDKSVIDKFIKSQMAWANELHLTPEQIEKLRTLNQNNQQSGELQAALQKMQDARRAVDELITSDHPNEELIKTRANELGNALVGLTMIRAKYDLMVRNILTPEQLEKFREIRRQWIMAPPFLPPLQMMRQNMELQRKFKTPEL